jgi:hypothetical protein
MQPKPTMIPSRLGKIAKDKHGSLVLINPKGKAYAVNNDLSSLWLMLDGEKTYDQLLSDHEELKTHIRIMLERLHSVELIEWRS